MTSDVTGRGGTASGSDYDATTGRDGSTRETYETTGGTTAGTAATTYPATTDHTYERSAAVGAIGKDRVRWGPIVAGLLTAISSFILLSLLATALGLQAVGDNTNAGAAAQTGAIVAAVLGLIAFFLGGLVAGATAAVRNRADGALNGFLMWALALLTILVLAGLGLGQVFGAAGDQFGNYGRLGTQGADRNAIADALRNGALGAFLGMLLPAIAATVGGWLGARDRDDTETVQSTNYRMERA